MAVSEIKLRGRNAFKANYWRCVVAAVLLVLLLGGAAASGAGNAQDAMDTTGSAPAVSAPAETQAAQQELIDALNSMPKETAHTATIVLLSAMATVSVIGCVLRIFVFNPLKVGCYRFFSKNVEDPGVTLDVLKEGFGSYGHTLGTLLLTDLFLVLWTLLLVVPGIIKAYSYRLVPYIIKDNPELSAMEVIKRSKELMDGNKWRAFTLDLSFIGWFLLGVLTLGLVNVFWTNPYHESAKAVFYRDLID